MVYLRIESKVLSTGGYMQTCPKCNQTKTAKHFYTRPARNGKKFSYCKDCNKQNVIDRKRQFKLKCLEYKSSQCSKCGYNKCPAALEFHHLDPSTKDFIPSHYSNTSWDKNKDKVMKELDKCIVLCANCHREEHFK
jgi:hypothetical protein